MDNYEKYAMVKNLQDLGRVKFQYIVDPMISCFGITIDDDYETIMGEKTNRGKMRQFLAILYHKVDRNPDIYTTLINELRCKGYKDIAKKLEKAHARATNTGTDCEDFNVFLKSMSPADSAILRDAPVYMNINNYYSMNDGATSQDNLLQASTSVRHLVASSSSSGGAAAQTYHHEETITTVQVTSRSNYNEALAALQTQDFDKLCNLANKGLNLNEKEEDRQSILSYSMRYVGYTSFITAVIAGDSKMVTAMLEGGGIGPDQKSGSMRTPLMYASLLGQTNIVTELLNHGAEVNAISNGSTALIYAAYSGNVETLKVLIENKADVNKRDVNNTALMIAVNYNKVEAVEILLSYNADVNATNKNQYTALMLAVEGRLSAIAKMLLDKGAKIDAGDTLGCTSLMKATKSGDLETMNLLLRYKADLEILDSFSFVALTWAATEGRMDALMLLLDQNTGVTTEIVKTAIKAGHTNVVTELLDRGFTGGDENTQMLVTEAVISNNPDMVQLLLNRGFSVVNGCNRYAVQWAAKNGNRDILTMLTNHGADVNSIDEDLTTPLMCAAKSNFSDILRHLLSCDVDINAKDVNGNTALMLAADMNHVNIVAILANTADVNAQNNNDETAMIIAAKNNCVAIAGHLIKQGANVNLKDSTGRSALIWAADRHHKEVILHLLKEDVEVNATDNHGRTALSYVASGGRSDLIHILSTHPGVDKTIRDVDGKTAYEYANINLREMASIRNNLKQGNGGCVIV